MSLLQLRDNSSAMPAAAWRPVVAIVEDDVLAADLAAELCDGVGADAERYSSPLPFLRGIREGEAPTAMVLDWRLEQELSAALFMAIRHRFAELPVIYWTGADPATLPSMINDDPLTRIVVKAGGTEEFEDALRWALAASQRQEPRDG